MEENHAENADNDTTSSGSSHSESVEINIEDVIDEHNAERVGNDTNSLGLSQSERDEIDTKDKMGGNPAGNLDKETSSANPGDSIPKEITTESHAENANKNTNSRPPSHAEQLAALTQLVQKMTEKVNRQYKDQEKTIDSLDTYYKKQISKLHKDLERFYFAPVRQTTRIPPPRLPQDPTATWNETEDPETQQIRMLAFHHRRILQYGHIIDGQPPPQLPQLQQLQQATTSLPPEPLSLNPQKAPTCQYFEPEALLGKPRTLLELWHEFVHGLDDNKPAKDFTPKERGQVKTHYCRRLGFWRVMTKLIEAGHNELTAIDLIRAAYGKKEPISNILKKLQKAKREGYHPDIAAVIGNDKPEE